MLSMTTSIPLKSGEPKGHYNEMAKTLKVAMIGVGGIARTHMPGWAASEHAEVVAGADMCRRGQRELSLEPGLDIGRRQVFEP